MISVSAKRGFGFVGKAIVGQSMVNRLFSSALPDTDEKMGFYTLGVNVARKVGEVRGVMDKDELAALAQGFSDAVQDKVTNENELYQKYGELVQKTIGERMDKVAAAQAAKGSEFINEYLTKNPTAVKTNSGLVFHKTQAGSGTTHPTAKSTVLVHYHGTLPNGQVFDSSVERGEPIEFPLNGVIRGWTEGVALMVEGEKATLVCPPELAYGAQGSPPVIQPGATLVFQVELIKIKS